MSAAAGRRDDGGKPRWDLMPPEIVEVVKVLTWACTREVNPYPARNWEIGMAWSKCFGPMMRHAWKWWAGEDLDPESGLSHMAHVACNAIFLLAYVQRLPMRLHDDRPREKPRGVVDPLKDCPSCAGTKGYHRTPCSQFEVSLRTN